MAISRTDMEMGGTELTTRHFSIHLGTLDLLQKCKNQNTHWIKNSTFNKQGWSKWVAALRRMKMDPYVSPCTITNPRRNKGFKINPEAMFLTVERERKLGLTSVRLVIGLFIEIVFLIDRYVYGIRYMYPGKGWQLGFGKSLKCSLRGYCC